MLLKQKTTSQSSLTWASGRHLRSLNSLPDGLIVSKVSNFDFHSVMNETIQSSRYFLDHEYSKKNVAVIMDLKNMT